MKYTHIPSICPECGEEGMIARRQSVILLQKIHNIKVAENGYVDYDYDEDHALEPDGHIDNIECLACGAAFDRIEGYIEAVKRKEMKRDK